MKRTVSGFTIVELIIVVVVISILATITIAFYNNGQAAARDTKRKSDLAKIAEAIQLYRQKYNSDVATLTLPDSNPPTTVQCAYGTSGNGWFNYATGAAGNYQYSVAGCLKAAGYLDGSSSFADPFGCSQSSGSGSAVGLPPGTKCQRPQYAYMKYTSGTPPNQITCLYAHLETSDDSAKLTDTSTANPCRNNSSANVANTYFMNYMVVVD